MYSKAFIQAFLLNAKKNGWKIKRNHSKCYSFIKVINQEHYSTNFIDKFIVENLKMN